MALLASYSCEMKLIIHTIRSASFLELIRPSLDYHDLVRPVEMKPCLPIPSKSQFSAGTRGVQSLDLFLPHARVARTRGRDSTWCVDTIMSTLSKVSQHMSSTCYV